MVTEKAYSRRIDVKRGMDLTEDQRKELEISKVKFHELIDAAFEKGGVIGIMTLQSEDDNGIQTNGGMSVIKLNIKQSIPILQNFERHLKNLIIQVLQ